MTEVNPNINRANDLEEWPITPRLVFTGRVESLSNGGERIYPLQAAGGGGRLRGVAYQISVLQTSGSAAKLGLRLDHGVDPGAMVTFSTPIAKAAAPTSFPGAMLGAAEGLLAETLRPVLLVESTGASQEWAQVEVYEMRRRR